MPRETLAAILDACLADPYEMDRYGVLADLLEEAGDPLADLLRMALSGEKFPFFCRVLGNKIPLDVAKRSRIWETAYSCLWNAFNDQYICVFYPWPAPVSRVEWINDVNSTKTVFLRHVFMDRDTVIPARDLPFAIQRAAVFILASQIHHSHRNIELPDGSSRLRRDQVVPLLSALAHTIEGYRDSNDLRFVLSHLESITRKTWNGAVDSTIDDWVKRIRLDVDNRVVGLTSIDMCDTIIDMCDTIKNIMDGLW